MGIFDDLFGKDKKKSQQALGTLSFMEDNKNKSEYTDEEMDAYDLEDWERKLVERGENDPWNFDENELEDDDYYSEDD